MRGWRDSHPNANSNGDAHGNCYSYTYCDCDGNANAYANRNSKRYTQAYSNTAGSTDASAAPNSVARLESLTRELASKPRESPAGLRKRDRVAHVLAYGFRKAKPKWTPKAQNIRD